MWFLHIQGKRCIIHVICISNEIGCSLEQVHQSEFVWFIMVKNNLSRTFKLHRACFKWYRRSWGCPSCPSKPCPLDIQSTWLRIDHDPQHTAFRIWNYHQRICSFHGKLWHDHTLFTSRLPVLGSTTGWGWTGYHVYFSRILYVTQKSHGDGLVHFHLDFDAAFVGVIGALASSIVLLVSACLSMQLSTAVVAGCFVVIVGSVSYFFHRRTNTDEVVQSTSEVCTWCTPAFDTDY